MVRPAIAALLICFATFPAAGGEAISTLQHIEPAHCEIKDTADLVRECNDYKTRIAVDLPKALEGDYQAMWTISLGMANGLGVQQNMIGACVWASLAIMTGNTRVTDSTVSMAKNGCSKLDMASFLVARRQFESLSPTVLKSPAAIFPFSMGDLRQP